MGRATPSEDINNDGAQPPPPPPRPPQLRQIAPKVVRASGDRPSTSYDATPIPPPPPPVPEGNGTVSEVWTAMNKNFANLLPGFKGADLREKKRYIKALERADRARKKSLGFGEWGADTELGDDWAYRPGEDTNVDQIVDRRTRYAGTDTPRDAWLRPIVDPQGIFDRLSFDRRASEARLEEEVRLNSSESRAALLFAGVWLFLVPFGLGFFISRGIAEPVIVYIHDTRPESLELSGRMKREGAKHIKAEELRIRLESSIGKAPALTPEEEFVRFHLLKNRSVAHAASMFYKACAVVVLSLNKHLQEAAHEFEREKKEEIRAGLVNAISDSITLTSFITILTLNRDGRKAIMSAAGRITQGMSQTGKAFIIILVADILMGYHSEEGWTAAIEILSEHYNAEIEFPPIAIFVSTVPVLLDSLFKYWLFKNLNRTDPSASVTLKEMDRH